MFRGTRPDSEEVIKLANPTPLGALQPRARPGLIDSKMQAIMTKSNASCKCSGYNTPNGKSIDIKCKKKAQGHTKRNLAGQLNLKLKLFIIRIRIKVLILKQISMKYNFVKYMFTNIFSCIAESNDNMSQRTFCHEQKIDNLIDNHQ